MGRLETYQKMDMIGHSSNALWRSVHTTNSPAEVFVKALPPLRGNDGFAVLGGENNMIEQAGVGRGHGGDLLAPLPGC
jgi:hypothetical protein